MQRRINRSTTILLKPLQGDAIPGGALFAVNWFDTRAAWLYDFYNLLAAMPLHKVGGRPLFKGRRLKTLSRRGAADREQLLIVRYPRAGALLDLLQGSYFQMISILRMLAVKRFSFVLHARADAAPEAIVGAFRHKGYALHHFRSSRPFDDELARASRLAVDQGLGIFFAGETVLTVATADGRGRARDLPFVTHKLVLFEADSTEALERVLAGADYESFTHELEVSYIALLERIL